MRRGRWMRKEEERKGEERRGKERKGEERREGREHLLEPDIVVRDGISRNIKASKQKENNY